MYKALIADDEQMIRQGIAKFLQRDDSIQVVAQAEDGEIALELARQHKPDILFVDINMPFMSGLEFIEALGEVRAGAVIVVVTGYDDFEYVRKALQLGVFEYLLKPVMEQPFFDCLERAKQKASAGRQSERYLAWAKQELEKNKPALVAGFLEGWLEGALSEPEIYQQMEYLDVQLAEPLGFTLVRPANGAVLPAGWDENLLYYATHNMAAELFSAHPPVASFRSRAGSLVLLSGTEGGWRETAQKLCGLVKNHLGIEIEAEQQQAQTLADAPALYAELAARLVEEARYSRTVQEAVRHIEEHCGDCGLSLQGTARLLHVSPQHLSRLFRNETGITFVDYVTRVRVRRAIQLLEQPDLKMYEIAEQVGYASQHYFSSAFKKVLGVSPAQFRQQSGKGRPGT